MGGSIRLTRISYCRSMEFNGYDEEEEAKKAAKEKKASKKKPKTRAASKKKKASAKDEPDEDEEEPEEYDPLSFTYSYRGWPWMKGELLQGSIAFLSSLKKQLDGEPTQFTKTVLLEDNGIKAVFHAPSDARARAAAKKAIPGVLKVLQSWTRTKTGRDLFGRQGMFGGGDLLGMGGGMGGMGLLGMAMMGGGSVADVTDAPYDLDKLNDLLCCPIEVERVGLRGLYYFLRLPDSNMVVCTDEAQAIAKMMHRVMGHIDWDEDIPEKQDGGCREAFDKLLAVMEGCVEGMVVQ